MSNKGAKHNFNSNSVLKLNTSTNTQTTSRHVTAVHRASRNAAIYLVFTERPRNE